jgi:hypothetical protein
MSDAVDERRQHEDVDDGMRQRRDQSRTNTQQKT